MNWGQIASVYSTITLVSPGRTPIGVRIDIEEHEILVDETSAIIGVKIPTHGVVVRKWLKN